MRRFLLGVGSRLSHDDGVGPEVASLLADSDWLAVDCGMSLENSIGIVVRNRPDLVVVVDAAKMGLPRGSIRRLPVQGSDSLLASTHSLPIPFVLERMREEVGRLVLIGIEPADLSLGEGLSPPVADAAIRLARILLRNRLDLIAALPFRLNEPPPRA